MAVSSKLLRRLQVGQEVTKGTPVAATAVLIVEDAAFDLAPTIYQPVQDLGLLADRDRGVETGRHVMFEISGDVSYEQILYWLNIAVEKVLTGVGAGADKTWTFAPSPTGADDLLTVTFETRHTDGTNNIDREYQYGLAQTLEISGTVDEPTKFSCSGFVKDETIAAITPALAVPASFIIPAAQDFKLFSDASFAALSTTQVAGQLHAFTWTLTTGLSAAFYIDGQKPLSRHRRVRRMAELELQLDQEAAASGFATLMRQRLLSRDPSYLSLKAVGAVLGGSNYSIALDGAYTVQSVSPPEDHEGEDSVTVTLRSFYDVTAAQDFRAIVVNATATLL